MNGGVDILLLGSGNLVDDLLVRGADVVKGLATGGSNLLTVDDELVWDVVGLACAVGDLDGAKVSLGKS